MFLTHWLKLSGVDRLMAPVSAEDDHASASHGPEEQEGEFFRADNLTFSSQNLGKTSDQQWCVCSIRAPGIPALGVID